MELVPLDIQKKEFHRTFRGYSEEEVDEFLQRVGREYELVYKENLTLKERLAKGDADLSRYRQIEETLNNTLILAQQTAEELRKNAEKEAELLLKEAQAKSAEMVAAAQRQAEEILCRYEEMRQRTQALRSQFKAFLLAQVELMEKEEEERKDWKQLFEIKEIPGGVQFKVKVQPRASRNRVTGVLADALKVQLTAPPVEGEANEAFIRFFAEVLGVPRGAVSIVSGATSRQKLVQVLGVGKDQIMELVKDSD